MSDENEIFAPDTEMYEFIVTAAATTTTTTGIGPKHVIFGLIRNHGIWSDVLTTGLGDIKNNQHQNGNEQPEKSPAIGCRQQKTETKRELIDQNDFDVFKLMNIFYRPFFYHNMTKGSIR